MKFRHGNIVFDAPEGWIDESKVVFAELTDDSIAKEMTRRAAASGAPLPAGQPALPRLRTNFVISSRPFTLDVPAREFCENELKAMLLSFARGKVGEFFWTKLGDVDAAAQDVEFESEDVKLRQLHALAVVDGRVLHFVGTTTPGAFNRSKDGFLATMASVRVEKQ